MDFSKLIHWIFLRCDRVCQICNMDLLKLLKFLLTFSNAPLQFMQACNKCCVLKYVFNLFCKPISLSLSRFVSQSPSHCRALWAVSKVLVSQALFGSLLLSFWLSNWLNLSLSLSLIQARSLWLTLALSGSPRLTLARSGSLSVFLRRSLADNVLAGLVQSLPQFILP